MYLNTFIKVVDETCDSQGIRGIGVCTLMSTYGFRGTMISLLTDAGFSNVAVVLRIEHRSMNSIKLHLTILKGLDVRQQAAVFGNPS